MKDTSDVLAIEDDQGTTAQKNWSESDLDTCTISWTSFSREGWKLPDSLRAQLKFDPLMASNRHEKCSYGKY